jgi:fructose/tagatose bisphosphate aldolase
MGSFLREGQRATGAAIVDSTTVMWAEPLPLHPHPQSKGARALIKALELGVSKKINIYTDSRYAFATAHIHRAIYQERGLLESEGKAGSCEYSLPRTSERKRLSGLRQ